MDHMDQSSEQNWEDEDRLRPNNAAEEGDTSDMDVTSNKNKGNEHDPVTGRHPLHNVAEQGIKNRDEVTDLINRYGWNVNVKVMIPESKCSKPECSKKCLCLREHIKCDYEGWTALHFAAREGHIGMVQWLLAAGDIDPTVQGVACGDTPLHVAAWWGWPDIVEEFLVFQPGPYRKHVDVNIVNKEGQTALHKAALESPDPSKYLVHKSPDVSTRERCEKFHQKFLRAPNIIPMFTAIGALHPKSRSSSPKEGITTKGANDKQVDHDYAKVVERLLKQSNVHSEESNVRLTIEDAEGRTALDIASKKKNGKVFEILRLKITDEVTDYNEPYYRERQANVDAANAILVGAALIASVTFAAWLQPPLGYTTDYQEQYVDAFPAPPTSNPVYASLEHHPMMEWFWAFNSLSFFCAIGTVIAGAHSVLPFRKSTIKQEVKKLRFNLLLTSTLMALSMSFVLFAFATAGIVVLPPVPRFKDNIFSTIGVGGGLCTLLLLRLGWNIFKSAIA